MSDFDWLFNEENELAYTNEETDTRFMPDMRSIRMRTRRKAKFLETSESLSEFLLFPEIGETLHLMANGSFDFFTIASVIIQRMESVDNLYASTWTTSQTSIQDLADYFDSGLIRAIHILSDVSFKGRKPAQYAMLLHMLHQRGQRFVASRNHSKVVLLNHQNHYITIECSASFTSTPRLEQHVITNDKSLWEFHRSWMEEIFSNVKT